MMSIARWWTNLHTKAYTKRLGSSHLYARGYAMHRQNTAYRNASLETGAAATLKYVESMIDHDEFFYDLIVLEKTMEKTKVKDRRGRIFDTIDLVSNSYNDLDYFQENRQELLKFVESESLSSCLSQKIAGLHQVHKDLMDEMTDFLGYERCILGTCGYITQISTVFGLMNSTDVIFSDQHNHSSIVDGCLLSKAKIITFKHRDYNDLERSLRRHRGHYNCAAIVSDGVFSTKGATANIDRIVDLAKQFNAISIIDDTHGIGVIGKSGRGVIDIYKSRPDVLTGGFAKAFGSFGGFCVTSRALGELIALHGRQNINTSFLSPILAAQSLIHVKFYRKNIAFIQQELFHKLRLFNDSMAKVGLNCYRTGEQYIHPIFCFYKKTESETLTSFRHLLDKGFLPSFFPQPVAPFPSLRFSFHRTIPMEEISRLANSLALEQLTVDPGDLSPVARPHLSAQHWPSRLPAPLSAAITGVALAVKDRFMRPLLRIGRPTSRFGR